MPATGARGQVAGVASSRRVLQVLLGFSERRPHLTVRDVAGLAGVPVSTAYRYLALLRETALVEPGERGTVHLTPRIVGVARAATAADPLVAAARPVLEELAARVPETVMLLRAVQDAAVLVDRVESTRPVRLSFAPGEPLALHAGAAGTVLLACMPPEQREAYLEAEAAGSPALAARLPRLRAELAEAAERGWAVSRGGIDADIWAVACAIRSPRGCHGALTVAGPEYRIPRAERQRIIRAVRDAAAQTGARLPAAAPPRPPPPAAPGVAVAAPDPTGARTSGMESPRRVLRMLLGFSPDRPHATVRELAAAVSAPAGAAYRYVALLREVGLLEAGPGGTWHVGPGALSLARAAAAAGSLADLARPLMRRLAEQVAETVMLVRVIGGEAVCVEQVEPASPVRLSVRPGQALPLFAGASGKTLLAFLPAAQREELLAARVRADPSFAGRIDGFRGELDRIAERGWATSSAEIDEGIWACSAAIRSAGGAAATLSVAGPAYRIDDTARLRILTQVRADAAELAKLTGGDTPTGS